MIEKGILAIMIISTINAILIISGFVSDPSLYRSIIPGLPVGLTPNGFVTSDTDLDFTETGVTPTSADLVTSALHAITTFLFNIPLAGDLLKAILSIASMFFDFMFFWSTALNASGLPTFIIFVISVPIAMFEYGVLVFLAIQIFQVFSSSRK